MTGNRSQPWRKHCVEAFHQMTLYPSSLITSLLIFIKYHLFSSPLKSLTLLNLNLPHSRCRCTTRQKRPLVGKENYNSLHYDKYLFLKSNSLLNEWWYKIRRYSLYKSWWKVNCYIQLSWLISNWLIIGHASHLQSAITVRLFFLKANA